MVSFGGKAWQNDSQGLTHWVLTLLQPGFSLPSSPDGHQLLRLLSLLPPAPSCLIRLTLSLCLLALQRGLMRGTSSSYGAPCQSPTRWLYFPGHEAAPTSNIFLGKHLYKEIKSSHMYISIYRLWESALWGFLQAQWNCLIESYIIRCFLKSIVLINILSPHTNVKAMR